MVLDIELKAPYITKLRHIRELGSHAVLVLTSECSQHSINWDTPLVQRLVLKLEKVPHLCCILLQSTNGIWVNCGISSVQPCHCPISLNCQDGIRLWDLHCMVDISCCAIFQLNGLKWALVIAVWGKGSRKHYIKSMLVHQTSCPSLIAIASHSFVSVTNPQRYFLPWTHSDHNGLGCR